MPLHRDRQSGVQAQFITAELTERATLELWINQTALFSERSRIRTQQERLDSSCKADTSPTFATQHSEKV